MGAYHHFCVLRIERLLLGSSSSFICSLIRLRKAVWKGTGKTGVLLHCLSQPGDRLPDDHLLLVQQVLQTAGLCGDYYHNSSSREWRCCVGITSTYLHVTITDSPRRFFSHSMAWIVSAMPPLQIRRCGRV